MKDSPPIRAFVELIPLSICWACLPQRDCIQFAMTARPRQRYMPTNKKTFIYKVWCVVDSKPFEVFIMVAIVLNAVIMMISVGLIMTSSRVF